MRVFLSYSRADASTADRLVDVLEAAGFDVIIDRRDLPYGEEWQDELANFIRSADTVVWLVSPRSIKSRWCLWELGEVRRISKRLIPVRIASVDPHDLPENLGKIHVLPGEGVYDEGQHLRLLIESLETNREWMRAYTRIADRASEWIARGRPGDRLLRGRALTDAEAWRDARPPAAPSINAEVLDLLLESRRETTRGLRRLVGIVVIALLVMTAMAGYAIWQSTIASQREREANERSVSLIAETVPSMVEDGQFVPALLMMLDAAPRITDSTGSSMEVALNIALNAINGRSVLPIPQSSVPFETVGAIYLFDPDGADLLSYNGIELSRIYEGTPDDSPIVAVSSGTFGTVFVRRDLTVWRKAPDAEAFEPSGRFSMAGDRSLVTENSFLVYPDGTILFLNPGDTDTFEDVGDQLLDPVHKWTVTIPSEVRSPLYHADENGRYVASLRDSILLEIEEHGATASLVHQPYDDKLGERAYFERCFVRGGSGVPPFVADFIPGYSDPMPGPSCIDMGDVALVSTFAMTSAGSDRDDFVIDYNGQPESLSMKVGQLATVDLDLDWVGGRQSEGALTLVAMKNRQVFASVGDLSVTRIEPERPAAAKIFDHRTLVLVEPKAGELVIIDLAAAKNRPAMYASNGTDQPFLRLNAGTCGFFPADAILPDGTVLRFSSRPSQDPSERDRILITADGDSGIPLELESGCVQVFPDGSTLLHVNHQTGKVELFDLKILVNTPPDDVARRDGPPAIVSTAYPMPHDGGVVTTSGDFEVLRWREHEPGRWSAETVFVGERPIWRAEPDASGDNLLLAERLAMGDVRAFMYSLPARREWLDVGTDYKNIAASLGTDRRLATGGYVGETMSVMKLPVLSQLMDEAEAALPVGCKPAHQGDYRTSACWPDWL